MLRKVASAYFPKENNPHFVLMIMDVMLNLVKEHIMINFFKL